MDNIIGDSIFADLYSVKKDFSDAIYVHILPIRYSRRQ